nr:MAG TPA: hypothetical protein [Caudoviricetes sp.]
MNSQCIPYQCFNPKVFIHKYTYVLIHRYILMY